MSKRTRHIPKVFTPDDNEGNRYCFCQREDCGWYLVCSFQTAGCLIYYHWKCVGLHHLQSQHDGSLYSIENITANDDFSDKKSAQISDYHKEDYSTSNPQHLSDYEIVCLGEESDDNANQISNTGFSESESTVNGVCEKAMVREENKKLNDSYCPDENDPGILSQFFDNDGWNSDNFDHMDNESEGAKERKNVVDINDLPVPHDTLSRMMDCPSLPTTSFFIADPQREAQFRLSEDGWNCIKPSIGQPRKSQPSERFRRDESRIYNG